MTGTADAISSIVANGARIVELLPGRGSIFSTAWALLRSPSSLPSDPIDEGVRS